MPNWCNNNIEIESDKEFTKFLKSVVDEDSNVENFFLKTLHIDNDGDDDWYNANLRQIGCKWDVISHVNFEENGKIFISFDSPWSPPIAGIESLAKEYKLSLNFYYEECGCEYIGRGSIDKLGYDSEETWEGRKYLKGHYIINGIGHIYDILDVVEPDDLYDFVKKYTDDLSLDDFTKLQHAIHNEQDSIAIELLKLN